MTWAKLFVLLASAEWTIADIAGAYGMTPNRVKTLIRNERAAA
jgi:plasmid maintenance system antidote protein VapI